MPFQVTNYHSKKALAAAVATGAKIHLVHVPLTKEQLKQNAAYAAAGGLAPHILQSPLPFSTYEIQGSFNKQVPTYFCCVVLNQDCFIAKVI